MRSCLVNHARKVRCFSLVPPKAGLRENLRCKSFIWKMNLRRMSEVMRRQWQAGEKARKKGVLLWATAQLHSYSEKHMGCLRHCFLEGWKAEAFFLVPMPNCLKIFNPA